MLNLYLAPKSGKSPVPTSEAIVDTINYLKDRGIIGPKIANTEYAAGPMASRIFHPDAENHYVPAELTFESLTVETVRRVTFLPEAQDIYEYHSVKCPVCADDMDVEGFQDALDRLAFFPVDSISYECPSCQSELGLRELQFGQNVGFARFWLFLEGVAFGRLRSQFVDALARKLELPLLVIPEVIDDQAEQWSAPPRFR